MAERKPEPSMTVHLLTSRVVAEPLPGGATMCVSQSPGDIVEVSAADGARMIAENQAQRVVRVRRLFEVLGEREAAILIARGEVERVD